MPTGVYTRTEYHRKKISKGVSRYWDNDVFSKEHRIKNSENVKGDKNNFRKPDIRIKLSEAKMGEKNFNWQNGKSFEPYSVDWTETLKRAIRERDNYICQICSQYGNTVHHIDYDKKNCNPYNLITLCHGCHMKTNFNRKYWIKKLNLL